MATDSEVVQLASFAFVLLTPKQAAEYLGVSPGTLAHWRSKTKRGKDLKFIDYGSKIYYRKEHLDQFLAQQVKTGGPAKPQRRRARRAA